MSSCPIDSAGCGSPSRTRSFLICQVIASLQVDSFLTVLAVHLLTVFLGC